MTETPHDRLDELASEDGRVRERAAAYLGDWLAVAAKTKRDVAPVVTALVDALLAEGDPNVQEEIAHSLGYLVEYGEVPAEIIRPLAQHLTRLDARAAEHVTDLLEASTWRSSAPWPGADLQEPSVTPDSLRRERAHHLKPNASAATGDHGDLPPKSQIHDTHPSCEPYGSARTIQ